MGECSETAHLALRKNSEVITCTKHRSIAWASGSLGPGAGSTRESPWSPAGQDPSHSPSQGGRQAGHGRQGQARIPIFKAHSDETGLGQEASPWGRVGIWINEVDGQARAWLRMDQERELLKCCSQEKGRGGGRGGGRV